MDQLNETWTWGENKTLVQPLPVFSWDDPQGYYKCRQAFVYPSKPPKGTRCPGVCECYNLTGDPRCLLPHSGSPWIRVFCGCSIETGRHSVVRLLFNLLQDHTSYFSRVAESILGNPQKWAESSNQKQPMPHLTESCFFFFFPSWENALNLSYM